MGQRQRAGELPINNTGHVRVPMMLPNCRQASRGRQHRNAVNPSVLSPKLPPGPTHLAMCHQGDRLPLALARGQLEEASGLRLHAVEQGRPRADAQPLLHLQAGRYRQGSSHGWAGEQALHKLCSRHDMHVGAAMHMGAAMHSACRAVQECRASAKFLGLEL